MRLLRALHLLALVALAPVTATAQTIELDYRLQPDRDVTNETTAEAITTLRVIEDRGIVAKSSGRMSTRPTTLHLSTRQSFRYITGSALSDGSFQATMLYLEKVTLLRLPDGRDQPLPDRTPLSGGRVTATIERDGRLREGSVELAGFDPSVAEKLKPTIASALAQAAAIAPISLARGQSVNQSMAMQLPLAGLASIDLQMRVLNRLLSVENGLARIEQVYSMDFTAPRGVLSMQAEGSGGGVLLYDVAARIVTSGETGTLMKMTLEMPEGTVEVQLDSRHSQKMRPTGAASR